MYSAMAAHTVRYVNLILPGFRQLSGLVFVVILKGAFSFIPVNHEAFISRESDRVIPSICNGVVNSQDRANVPSLLFASPHRNIAPSISLTSRIGNPQGKDVQTKIAELCNRDSRGEQLSQTYCDSVLASCFATDEWDSVLDVLEVMKRQGLSQERTTYRAALQKCLKVGNGASARKILNAMRGAKFQPDAVDIAVGVAAMCRNDKTESGWWRRALSILKLTADQANEGGGIVAVDAYDSVLTCMANQRQWKDALRLLNLMEQGFNLEKESFHPTPVLSTYRIVIENCVAACQAEQAVQIVLSMKGKGVEPNAYTFELVISALSKKQLWRRALELLNVMDDLKIPQTVVTYNTVISACARAKEVGKAKGLLISMRKQGIKPNIISYNSLMTACAGAGRWKDALSIIDQCDRDPDVDPDIITYTNGIRACTRGGNTRRGLSLLDVVKKRGLPLDVYCYTAAIDACAKGKMWRRALDLLDEMRQNDVLPNEITYSVAISACGNGGQWERALELLYQMKQNKMKINTITYNSAITALSKASRQNVKQASRMHAPRKFLSEDMTTVPLDVDEQHLWMRALELLEQMKADGLEPDGFSYSAAISACGSGGRYKEALDLIKIMKFGGLRTRPNKIAYTSAISACGRAGEWEHALKLFTDMKHQGLQPDRVSYNTLLSALKVSDMPHMAYEIWEEMCGKKPTTLTSRATARADASMSPDIITVTEIISALDNSDAQINLERVDLVFAEAVQRGIIMRGGLDSIYEVDLSGMSFPVARAACRYILQRTSKTVQDNKPIRDIMLITGIGRGHRQGGNTAERYQTTNVDFQKSGMTGALREYVRQVLRQDFDPPVYSDIPERQQGTVAVKKEMLLKWIEAQSKT